MPLLGVHAAGSIKRARMKLFVVVIVLAELFLLSAGSSVELTDDAGSISVSIDRLQHSVVIEGSSSPKADRKMQNTDSSTAEGENQKNAPCSICMNEVGSPVIPFSDYFQSNRHNPILPKQTVITRCDHVFCGDCLLTSYRHGNKFCPLCRTLLMPEDAPIGPRFPVCLSRILFSTLLEFLSTACWISSVAVYVTNLPTNSSGMNITIPPLSDEQQKFRTASSWIYELSSWAPVISLLPFFFVLWRMSSGTNPNDFLEHLRCSNNVYLLLLFPWYFQLLVHRISARGFNIPAIAAMASCFLLAPAVTMLYTRFPRWACLTAVIPIIILVTMLAFDGICERRDYLEDLPYSYAGLWSPVAHFLILTGVFAHYLAGYRHQ